MNRLEPTVLIALQSAGFPEPHIADILNVDIHEVNAYLDYFSLGFDCALVSVGNRLEKAGFSDETITAVLGNCFYRDLRDSLTMLPVRSKEKLSLDQFTEYLNEEQLNKLKCYKEGKKHP